MLTYRADAFPGVAFRVLGPHTQPDSETWCTGEESDTGFVRAVMVGDDRVFVLDPDDLTPIDEDDYCHGCGQLGCSHDGRDRT